MIFLNNGISEKGKRDYTDLTFKQKCAISLVDYVKPTHFITLSLNQARRISSDYHETWARGDDTIYSETHRSFIQSLSKRLWSRTSYKFHHPSVRSACVVEGGRNGMRNHLHMIVAKPSHIDEMRFRVITLRTAAGNAWIMNGEHAVDIQCISGGMDAINAAYYSVKHGIERLTLS